MIELAFGESPAGGLKLAKLMKHGERLFGAVEALTLALDIGDISDMNADMYARKKVLHDLFADFTGVSDEIWKTNQHALTRIQETRSTLEHIRIWVCTNDPVEMCGLYFICYLMADASTPLSIVGIPMQIEKDNTIINYRSTGEIVPENFGAFIEYEKPISELQRKVYANIWNDLVRENAPMRAIINGNVIGVPADFYDFALRTNMPDGEFLVAKLIGTTLGHMPGVGDRWLFIRIQAMIRSGELIEVSAATSDHPYSGIVKRGKKITT